MHTTTVKTDEGEVFVIHNGDWSGIDKIRGTDPADGKMMEAEVPAPLFLALSKEIAISVVRDRVAEALDRI